MPQRNIVFFHAESWDGRKLGNMGHPALARATPNLDRVAASGTQFDHTYCTHPICCPSRANMWSGHYTHNLESWNNQLVSQWNSLVGQRSRRGCIPEVYIHYDFNIDYGKSLNHKLFYYFRFVQEGCRPFSVYPGVWR